MPKIARHSAGLSLCCWLTLVLTPVGLSADDGDLQPFVIGGAAIEESDVPEWLANYRIIISDSITTPICAATLIADGWAMTAAHCLFVLRSRDGQRFPIPADRIYLQFDQADFDDDRTYPNESGARGERFVIQPRYSDSESAFDSDVALIKLADPPTGNRTPAMPAMSEPAGGDLKSLLGWGVTDPTADPDERETILQRLDDHPVVDRDTCRGDYASGVITDNMICAGERDTVGSDGSENNAGPCFGDSGGPLFEEQNGLATQNGIVSFGTRNCGENTPEGETRIPSVYTNVAAFRGWIEDTVIGDPAGALDLAIDGSSSFEVQACEAFTVNLEFEPDQRRERIFDPRYFTTVAMDINSLDISLANGTISLDLALRDESPEFPLTIRVFDHFGNSEDAEINVTVEGSQCTGNEGPADIQPADSSTIEETMPPGQDDESSSSGSGSSGGGGGGGSLSWPWALLLMLGAADRLKRRRLL